MTLLPEASVSLDVALQLKYKEMKKFVQRYYLPHYQGHMSIISLADQPSRVVPDYFTIYDRVECMVRSGAIEPNEKDSERQNTQVLQIEIRGILRSRQRTDTCVSKTCHLGSNDASTATRLVGIVGKKILMILVIIECMCQ